MAAALFTGCATAPAGDGPPWHTTAGAGEYAVRFNYSGQRWWHADVQPIRIATQAPIAVLPMQYTTNGEQPGAFVNGRHVGRLWNTITQQEMARRLRAMGFHVLEPTIQMYGENLAGFQGLEHFIAGVHKGNAHVQTVLLTADAHALYARHGFRQFPDAVALMARTTEPRGGELPPPVAPLTSD